MCAPGAATVSFPPQHCLPATHSTTSAQCHGEKLHNGNTSLIFAVQFLQLKKSQNKADVNKKRILF